VGTLTSDYLRANYLRGMDLGESWMRPSGDAAMQTLLQTWIEAAQGKLGIQFARQRIKTYPDAGLVLGVDFEIQGEPLTYFQALPGQQHFVIPLPFANVQSIERVRLFYGNPQMNPQTHSLYQVPMDWILFTQKEGILKINPSITNAVLQTQMVGGSTGGFESIYYGYFHRGEIPGAWAVDYTVGYGRIPFDAAHWICLNAAIPVLSLAGMSTGGSHGLASQSLSMDGVSESLAYAQGKYGPYSGVIETYMAELACIDIGNLKMRYHGIKVSVW
jgi:hypothetical protein